jgi:hypothetical protein
MDNRTIAATTPIAMSQTFLDPLCLAGGGVPNPP